MTTDPGNPMTRLPMPRRLALLALLVPVLALQACGSPEEGAAPPAAAVGSDGGIELTDAQRQSIGIRVEPVHLEPLAETRAVPATVVSPDTASAVVGSMVEGRVERVQVLPGDRVVQGQALMVIQSQAAAEAQSDLVGSTARLDYARAASERAEALLAAGAISREEAERRRSETAAAEAELTRSRAQMDRLSPSGDGRVTVRAPRGGTVFRVEATPGMVVLPGTELVHLGRTDLLWVTGWVPERLSPSLAPGDSLEVLFPALHDVRGRAVVVQAGGIIDEARRAVELRAEFVELPAGVRPGLFATLLVPLGPREPRAVLPGAAVQRTPEGEVVFAEEADGSYRAVPVHSIVLPDGRVAVSGVEEGLRVVVAGAYALRSVLELAGTGGGQ